MSFTWTNSRMNTSDQGLLHPFEGPGAVSNGLTGIKNALMKCLFSIGAEHTTFVSVPTRKSKGLRPPRCWAVPRKLFADICWHERLSLFWCGELTPEVCLSILDTPYKNCAANNVSLRGPRMYAHKHIHKKYGQVGAANRTPCHMLTVASSLVVVKQNSVYWGIRILLGCVCVLN
jgi:hypothetical protein